MSKVTNLFLKGKKVMIGSELVQFDKDGVAEVLEQETCDIIVNNGLKHYIIEEKPDEDGDEDEKGDGSKNQTNSDDENGSQEKPTQSDQTPEISENLDALTVAELKSKAKALGIDVTNLTKKTEFIEAIKTGFIEAIKSIN